MRIKFNWGTGIAITIVVMVMFMLSLVYIATKQDFYLVEDDYYEQGVKFQDKIEKRKNTKNLRARVELVQNLNSVIAVFPPELSDNNISGTLYFYSPVNKSYDYKTEIETKKDLKQNVDKSKLQKGRYIVKIDWSSGGKSFYQEENLIVK